MVNEEKPLIAPAKFIAPPPGPTPFLTPQATPQQSKKGEKEDGTPEKDTSQLQTDQATMANASINAPPFSSEKPALWFAQLESQFIIRKIENEREKFHYAVPLIDTRSAAEIEDIITNPHQETPYSILKETLISRFSKSKEAKLLQLLDGESLGDRTPSQHLRHLRSLCPGVDEQVLKARWFSHLPDQTRACLVNQDDSDLTKLGTAADRLHEILKPQNVAAVSNLEAQVASLTRKLEQVSNLLKNSRRSRSHSRNRTRSNSQHRSKSRETLHKSGICWYHFKFGNDARKCATGCKHKGNDPESH